VSPPPAWKGTPVPRTLLSPSLGKIFLALLGHGVDAGSAWGLLRFAWENGDAQVERARLTFDGTSWTLDLFGQREAA
jgi:hypothetical protein